MVGKMVINMTYIVIMLLISLLSFGLARQSITYPNEDWHWLLVRNIFYKPYFMLYGEVYAPEIDTCGDTAWDEHMSNGMSLSQQNYSSSSFVFCDALRLGENCVTGHWIPPILMTVFLLISNILLISMLIAIFKCVFLNFDLRINSATSSMRPTRSRNKFGFSNDIAKAGSLF